MALTDENGSGNGFVMPVAPYNGNGNGGFGFGGDWAWILLLLVLFGGNGFGNGFGGGDLYPWMNNSNQINGGFRDQMLGTQINGIQSAITSGFGDVQTALCGGFAGVNAGIANGFAQAEIANNARQIADMQQMFGIQSSLQQCCCDNRAGLADLKYTVATEACADRSAISDALRDVISANTASTQRILDQLCADKIEAKHDTIAQLRSELMYARGQASQDVQTAALRAGQPGTAPHRRVRGHRGGAPASAERLERGLRRRIRDQTRHDHRRSGRGILPWLQRGTGTGPVPFLRHCPGNRVTHQSTDYP